MSNTNSHGFEDLNSKFMKGIYHLMSLQIAYLIENIILTKQFPSCLKVRRLLPILKPEKSKLDRQAIHQQQIY